jgi:acetyl/propionyl-CoA carboxylase alpha subunit
MGFSKVLILNRGEIACRLIQAVQEMGMKAVAIYSESDRSSRHVELADESLPLKGNAPQETYLNLPLLLDLAGQAGCDAVHPGYGFLSERAGAAEAFLKAGIEWIGPRPESIRLLGDKLEAKKLLERFKVPTAPWGEVDPGDLPSLEKLAGEIGYPVILKAASGGGGKGMRLVRDPAGLLEAATTAAREAKASFGDATLLLEKFIESPGISRFRSWATFTGTCSIWENGNALCKGATRRWWRKPPHLTCPRKPASEWRNVL